MDFLKRIPSARRSPAGLVSSKQAKKISPPSAASPSSPSSDSLLKSKDRKDYYAVLVKKSKQSHVWRAERVRWKEEEKQRLIAEKKKWDAAQLEAARDKEIKKRIAEYEGSPPSSQQSARQKWGANVANDGLSLEYAPRSLRDDPGLVRIAVTNNGLALAFATAYVRCARDVVLAAIAQHWRAVS